MACSGMCGSCWARQFALPTSTFASENTPITEKETHWLKRKLMWSGGSLAAHGSRVPGMGMELLYKLGRPLRVIP
eukprot:1152494-Pelagomonas_calceolata.AAC.5